MSAFGRASDVRARPPFHRTTRGSAIAYGLDYGTSAGPAGRERDCRRRRLRWIRTPRAAVVVCVFCRAIVYAATVIVRHRACKSDPRSPGRPQFSRGHFSPVYSVFRPPGAAPSLYVSARRTNKTKTRAVPAVPRSARRRIKKYELN